MPTKFTNKHNISVSLAAWLASDDYDYSSDPNYVSATTLLRPTKQVVLGKQAAEQNTVTDVWTRAASRIGSAVHDSIEKAWSSDSIADALMLLGVSSKKANAVLINPTKEDLALATKDSTIVYIEQRSVKELDGMKIGGKFDFVINGALEDFKSTGTYTYIKDTNAEDYIFQGSIYRWLNQDIITKDYITINYIFKDWKVGDAKKDPNYPQSPCISKKYKLLSVEDTEAWIKNRIHALKLNMGKPESDLLPCSDDELWRDEPKYKYYKDPNKRTRSTKNFSNSVEAYARLAEDGGTGIVVEDRGAVRRCNYCPGLAVCNQKDSYLEQGVLELLE